jgi:ketosteroid isomerase-like protein
VERRSVQDGVAVDAGYMRMQMTRPDGQKGAQYARFLVTMRRDASGRWRIIGDASIRTDEAAWNAAPRAAGLRYDA